MTYYNSHGLAEEDLELVCPQNIPRHSGTIGTRGKVVKLEIDVDLPREVLDQIPSADLGNLCRVEIVLRLYSEQKLAPVEAANLLSLSRIQFLDLLRERGVGFLAELEDEDFRQIESLRQQYQPKAS
jgi:predicted HTH domain antitoxin